MNEITKPAAMKMVKKWECLGYPFPKTAEGVDSLASEFMKITGDVDRAQWLSDLVVRGCPRCPTPIELRRIFSTKYPPADGVSSNESEVLGLMSVGESDRTSR